jgi:hypothetical protein
MKEHDNENSNIDFSKINRFIIDELLKIGDSPAIIEYLKKIPEDPDKSNKIKIIVDLKLSHYDGENPQKIELKKILFSFAKKIKQNELIKVLKSLNCLKNIQDNMIEKKNIVLCNFITDLILLKRLILFKKKKFYLILGIWIIAVCIIIEYIFNLITHQRNLIEGLVYAISTGLVYSIVFTVGIRFLYPFLIRRKEKKKIKSSKF